MKTKTPSPEQPKTKIITFHAIISPTAAALDGHGESGFRLKLEVDDMHLHEVLPVYFFRNKRLLVTIQEAQ